MKLAIVGTGISGLSAAWRLHGRHDVRVFEREGRPGGHSHTVGVGDRGLEVPVDTGFLVYNEVTYPNLVKLFARLVSKAVISGFLRTFIKSSASTLSGTATVFAV